MLKVIIDPTIGVKYIEDITKNTPIFAMKNGKYVGMILKEDKGWCLNLGGSTTSAGYFSDRLSCVRSALYFKYELYIEKGE